MAWLTRLLKSLFLFIEGGGTVQKPLKQSVHECNIHVGGQGMLEESLNVWEAEEMMACIAATQHWIMDPNVCSILDRVL